MLSKSAEKSRAKRKIGSIHHNGQNHSISTGQPTNKSRYNDRWLNQSLEQSVNQLVEGNEDLPHDPAACVLCNSSLTQTEDNSVSFLQFFDLLCIVFDYLPITQVLDMARLCPQWKQILLPVCEYQNTQPTHCASQQSTDQTNSPTGDRALSTAASIFQSMDHPDSETLDRHAVPPAILSNYFRAMDRFQPGSPNQDDMDGNDQASTTLRRINRLQRRGHRSDSSHSMSWLDEEETKEGSPWTSRYSDHDSGATFDYRALEDEGLLDNYAIGRPAYASDSSSSSTTIQSPIATSQSPSRPIVQPTNQAINQSTSQSTDQCFQPGLNEPFKCSQWADKSYLTRVTSISLSTSPFARFALCSDLIAAFPNLSSVELVSPFHLANVSTLFNVQFLCRVLDVQPDEAEFERMWQEHNTGVNKQKTSDAARLEHLDRSLLRAFKNRQTNNQPNNQTGHQRHQIANATGLHIIHVPAGHGVNAPVGGNMPAPHRLFVPPANGHDDENAAMMDLFATTVHHRHAEAAHKLAAKLPVCVALLPAASSLKTLIFLPELLQAADCVSISRLTSLTSLSLLPSAAIDTLTLTCVDQMLQPLHDLTTLRVAGNRNTLLSNVINCLSRVPKLTTLAIHATEHIQVEDVKVIVSSLPNLFSLVLSSGHSITDEICQLLGSLANLTHLELHVVAASHELPRALFELNGLESLVMHGALAMHTEWGNHSFGLPNAFRRLHNLRCLSIRGCFDSVDAIAEAVLQMPSIQKLDFLQSPLTMRCRNHIQLHRPDICLLFDHFDSYLV